MGNVRAQKNPSVKLMRDCVAETWRDSEGLSAPVALWRSTSRALDPHRRFPTAPDTGSCHLNVGSLSPPITMSYTRISAVEGYLSAVWAISLGVRSTAFPLVVVPFTSTRRSSSSHVQRRSKGLDAETSSTRPTRFAQEHCRGSHCMGFYRLPQLRGHHHARVTRLLARCFFDPGNNLRDFARNLRIPPGPRQILMRGFGANLRFFGAPGCFLVSAPPVRCPETAMNLGLGRIHAGLIDASRRSWEESRGRTKDR